VEIAEKLEIAKTEDSMNIKAISKNQENELNVLKDVLVAANAATYMESMTIYCMIGIGAVYAACWLVKIIAARALMETN
jgi:hypothetical protein